VSSMMRWQMASQHAWRSEWVNVLGAEIEANSVDEVMLMRNDDELSVSDANDEPEALASRDCKARSSSSKRAAIEELSSNAR